MADTGTQKLLLVIIAILLPPLAVGLKAGLGGVFVLNLILTLIFWIPGVLHALYVVLSS
ncbi:MAG: YqaE/Pmp3 family membrane protein [Phycisphaeraceae bacterium]|nr:YqaE/Pmp3 family membrane protein [Phycisphaeraceae bacterium]